MVVTYRKESAQRQNWVSLASDWWSQELIHTLEKGNALRIIQEAVGEEYSLMITQS